MADDRLEEALEALRGETVDAAALDAARGRVWHELTGTGGTCAAFQPDLPAYATGALVGSRRVLLEDHLSRCPACRASLADLKGERRVIPMPRRSAPRAKRWMTWAAAAAVILMVLYGGRERIDAWMAPAGPRASVVSAEGGLYRMEGGALAAGATIAEAELVRTAPGAHAVLRLADGSTLDVNERTEIYVNAAWSGLSVHLQRGDVIVTAAIQRRGHLRVLTHDSIAAVKGTVFTVSAGLGGSVVSVIEGSVAVRQPGTDVLLKPGQQAASSAALAAPIDQLVAWSPNAEQYIDLLRSFGQIEQQLASRFPTGHRTSSQLLPYLPGGVFAYGAVPNLTGRIIEALGLAEQQSSENATFASWWNSETGRVLRDMVGRVQSVSGNLGDEIVLCASLAGPGREVPIVLARVLPGHGPDLSRALDALMMNAGEPALPYSLAGDLMVISNSQTNLAWALSQIGRGAGSPFATAIAERYQRGAGWLFGVEAATVTSMAAPDDAPPAKLASMMGVKYVFFEQRAPSGAEENEVTLKFDGTRTGMGAWLADAGSGAAAEYLPSDALAAGYVSTREPSLLFKEFTDLLTKADPTFTHTLDQVNQQLGATFMTSLTSAVGTEAAVAVNGLSVTGPRWMMAVVAYNPAIIDSSIATFVESVNAGIPVDQQDKRLVVTQETAGDRVWNTLSGGGVPFGVSWTYDRGYLVAASDRATAERSIAIRGDGTPLVWSQEFRGQLPAGAGLHPSAFVWVNTKGALGQFPLIDASPAMSQLLAQHDPILVILDVNPDQIRAVSRTRLSSVILDAMAFQALNDANQGPPTMRVLQ